MKVNLTLVLLIAYGTFFLCPLPVQAAAFQQTQSKRLSGTKADPATFPPLTNKQLNWKEKTALKWLKARQKKAERKKDDRRLSIYALLGFIAAVLGIFFPPLFLAAFILSIIGLRQTSRAPDQWKGKGFAIAGLVLTGVFIIIAILALAGFIGIL
jgi:hypothetical protein